MTGHNWRGADSFHMAPGTYGGAHLDNDALALIKEVWCTGRGVYE